MNSTAVEGKAQKTRCQIFAWLWFIILPLAMAEALVAGLFFFVNGYSILDSQILLSFSSELFLWISFPGLFIGLFVGVLLKHHKKERLQVFFLPWLLGLVAALVFSLLLNSLVALVFLMEWSFFKGVIIFSQIGLAMGLGLGVILSVLFSLVIVYFRKRDE